IIEEGNRRYAVINTSADTAASSLERLGASIINLSQKIGGLLATALAPFADFLSGSLGNSLAAIGLIAALAFSKAGQALGKFIQDSTAKLTAFNDSVQAKIA